MVAYGRPKRNQRESAYVSRRRTWRTLPEPSSVVSIGYSRGAVVDRRQATATTQSSKVPDYFDTIIGWFAGRHKLGPLELGHLSESNSTTFKAIYT